MNSLLFMNEVSFDGESRGNINKMRERERANESVKFEINMQLNPTKFQKLISESVEFEIWKMAALDL